MQRGRHLSLAALAGALALAAGMASAAPPPPAPTAAAPVGIFTGDAALSDGANMGSGSITVSGTGAAAVYTVTAIGEDIQGNKDRGYFAYTTLAGDGGITARVLTQTGGSTGGWMKNGVMIRQSVDPGSPMAAINYTGVGKNNKNAEVEWLIRSKANSGPAEGSFNRDLSAGPVWLRAQRQGTTVQTLSSDNGEDWKLVQSGTLPIKATDPVVAGLDASSQSKTVAATGTLDNVSVSSEIVQPNFLPGPSPIEVQPGNAAVLLTFPTVPNAVGYNVTRQIAGGTDKPMLLTAQPDPYGWFVDTGLTNGTSYLYTITTVTLSKADNTTLLEGAGAQVLAEPQVAIPPGFVSRDITTLTPGSTTLANGVLTITASGADITGTGPDGFRFVSTPVSGDYTISAKLLDKPSRGPKNTETWVKAGVMIRASLDPRSAAGWVVGTTGQGAHYEHRADYAVASNNDNGTTAAATTFPLFVRMTKAGDNISGFQSSDGTTYTQIGKAVTFTGISLNPVTYAGLAVTAHKDATMVTAQFDAASITIQ